MNITRETILDKKFKRVFKGYDELEVDRFLDELAMEIEALSLKNLEAEKALSKYTTMENALSDSLVFANKSASDLIANAQKKSEDMIKEARKAADDIIIQASGVAEQSKSETLKEAQLIIKNAQNEADKVRITTQQEIDKKIAEHEKNIQKLIRDEVKINEFVSNLKNSVVDVIDKQRDIFVDAFSIEERPEVFKEYSNKHRIDLNTIAKTAPRTDEELKNMIEEIV